MTNPTISKDGLLLLLQAAEKIDKESSKHYYQPETWEIRSSTSRNSFDAGTSNSPTNYSCTIRRREVSSTRCAHNELEKSRRAHLRTCMEALKEHLVFDGDASRITMLTVLRKAAITIHSLQQKNEYLETCEAGEKQRCATLLKRRQTLHKKLDAKRNRNLKIQSWQERNRNYSECSANTNSSDDSEMAFNSQSLPIQTINILPGCTVIQSNKLCTTNQFTSFGTNNTYSVQSYQKISPSPVTGHSPLCGTDTYDASSSDSGFEEVTVACTDESQEKPAVGKLVNTKNADLSYNLQAY